MKVHHELRFHQRAARVRDLNLTSCTLRKPTASRSHAMTASRSASNGKPLWIRNDGNPLCKRLPSIILMTVCRQTTACRCERDCSEQVHRSAENFVASGSVHLASRHKEFAYYFLHITCRVITKSVFSKLQNFDLALQGGKSRDF